MHRKFGWSYFISFNFGIVNELYYFQFKSKLGRGAPVILRLVDCMLGIAD